MGYPVGYLKYPEGVKRMASEVGKANSSALRFWRSIQNEGNIAYYFVIFGVA